MNRVRSTSPVSSKASTLLRQQSLITRKSLIESQTKTSVQEQQTGGTARASLRDDSDLSKNLALKIKSKQKSKRRIDSLEHTLKFKKEFMEVPPLFDDSK